MNTDKPTKLLLAAIAVALWLIALNPWVHPTPVVAQGDVDLSTVESYLAYIQADTSQIQSDISSIESSVGRIGRGTCSNSNIC